MNFIRAYLRFTRHYYYGLLLTLPVFILYEAGIWWLHNYSRFRVRNLIDVVVKYIIQHIGASGFFSATIGIFMLMVLLLRPKRDLIIFRVKYIWIFIIESCFFALAFAVGMYYGEQLVMAVSADLKNYISGVILSCGAGFYEELFFRVCCFGGLYYLAKRVIGIETTISWVIAAVVSSVIFSLAHFIGMVGDMFGWYPFFFRLIGGLYFCLIYYFRGFAVAVYAHAIYDILLVFSLFNRQFG